MSENLQNQTTSHPPIVGQNPKQSTNFPQQNEQNSPPLSNNAIGNDEINKLEDSTTGLDSAFRNLLVSVTPNNSTISNSQSAPAVLQHNTATPGITPIRATNPRRQSLIPEIQFEVTYNLLEEQSKNFLDFKSKVYSRSLINGLFEKFQDDYERREISYLNITNYSSRMRIYLLNKIITHKLLSRYKNTYFEKKIVEKSGWRPFSEYSDIYPTSFIIGDFVYMLKIFSTNRQPGSGRLYGLTSESYADTYNSIHRKISGLKNLSVCKQLLLDQKNTGIPIVIPNDVGLSRFLNGYGLILDYEVARRLVTDDCYMDIPLIYFTELVVQNLSDDSYLNSLFISPERISETENLIPNLGLTGWTTKEALRDKLRALHKSDEVSEEEEDRVDLLANDENSEEDEDELKEITDHSYDDLKEGPGLRNRHQDLLSEDENSEEDDLAETYYKNSDEQDDFPHVNVNEKSKECIDEKGDNVNEDNSEDKKDEDNETVIVISENKPGLRWTKFSKRIKSGENVDR